MKHSYKLLIGLNVIEKFSKKKFKSENRVLKNAIRNPIGNLFFFSNRKNKLTVFARKGCFNAQKTSANHRQQRNKKIKKKDLVQKFLMIELSSSLDIMVLHQNKL